MSDERVWLRHKETGHLWECPTGAVDGWTTPELGWEVTDERPVEDNPVVAHLLAAQQAAQATTKSSRNTAETTTQEG